LSPACIVLGSWFLLQLFSSMNSSLSEQGIAFWAHVGGFASGTVLATGLYQLVQHEARRRVTQLQSHLDGAWTAFLQGREREARESLHQFRLAMEDRYVAEQPLLTGLLHYHDQPDSEEGAAFFYRAFQRGVDRLDKGAAMTAYLQMIEFLPAHLIPAEIHRDGAYVALSCCQPVPALSAMEKAFGAELDEGAESLLLRAEAVLRNMLDLPDEAGRIAELMAVHGQRQFCSPETAL
jgi:hypothetical protein